jgi:hypothetical protein
VSGSCCRAGRIAHKHRLLLAAASGETLIIEENYMTYGVGCFADKRLVYNR